MTRLRQEGYAGRGPIVVPLRAPDGRYASQGSALPLASPDQAREIYENYLAAVCRHQGLYPNEVKRELARPGRPNRDTVWRAATYARQLALYLANTGHNLPQAMLAEVAGMTPAAVCFALQAIEDLREVATYDHAVDMVAAEMGAV